jgi:hypothetical protein
MSSETLDLVELGEAEALIEIGMPVSHEEAADKYMPSAAPYIEFE